MKDLKFRCWYSGRMVPVGNIEFFTDESLRINDELVVKRENVMQFTGLKDKNGKEIYEKDVLKLFDKVVAVVVWEFNGWCFEWIDPTYIRIRQTNPEPLFRNINLFEVIGNIYENPGLLTHEISPTL